MCDPTTMAGVALSGAGSALGSIASNQVQSAVNAAEQQNQYLNGIQEAKAFAANNKARQEYTGFEAGQTAMGQKLGDYLAGQSVGRAAPPSQLAPTGGSTQAAVAAGAQGVDARGVQAAGAQGDLNSFGDYLAQQNRGANRHFEQAAQANNFMQGNNAVLQLQLADAQHAGDTTSLFGSLASGLGGLGVKAGLLTPRTGFFGNSGSSPLGSLFGDSSKGWSIG